MDLIDVKNTLLKQQICSKILTTSVVQIFSLEFISPARIFSILEEHLPDFVNCSGLKFSQLSEYTEAVTVKACSVKKSVLNFFLQISQDNTCVGVSF